MYLSNLSLLNFKNISQADLELSNRVNCFLGDNGQGKTNLLDAIYHLSYTKSFFNSIDSQNVMFDESLYVIQGAVKNEQEEYKLYCGLKKGEKKIFKKNKKIYKKLAKNIVLKAPGPFESLFERMAMRTVRNLPLSAYGPKIITQLRSLALEGLHRWFTQVLASMATHA